MGGRRRDEPRRRKAISGHDRRRQRREGVRQVITPVAAGRRPFDHEIRAGLGDAQALRRELHRTPRTGGDEEPVARLLATRLGRAEAPSIAGGRILRFGPADGPAVALRAELDALPIDEETGVRWASRNGAMHACGHDVHMAALALAVGCLRKTMPDVPVVALLQPREETYPCGAPDLLGSDEWAGANIGAVVGGHLQPRLPAGVVSAAPGAVNAASDEFELTVHGVGGHAAYPHTVEDPVVAAAAIVGAMQHIVSRRTDPMQPAVVSIGSVRGGQAANIIPNDVRILGTVRTFDSAQREDVKSHLEAIGRNVAAGYGCTTTLRIVSGEPVLTNSPDIVHRLRPNIREQGMSLGEDLRSCGADDFAYYSDAVASVMVFVGTGDGTSSSPGLHSPRFLPPESAVEDVARVLLAGFSAANDHLRADMSSRSLSEGSVT
nr:M20 family metallopeptidase [Nocardioides kongjuensis]